MPGETQTLGIWFAMPPWTESPAPTGEWRQGHCTENPGACKDLEPGSAQVHGRLRPPCGRPPVSPRRSRRPRVPACYPAGQTGSQLLLRCLRLGRGQHRPPARNAGSANGKQLADPGLLPLIRSGELDRSSCVCSVQAVTKRPCRGVVEHAVPVMVKNVDELIFVKETKELK